ncbi:MAG: FecR domain-containing protein [Candidatus Aminicenantes bacterium]|nr:FecR domain-containing protein [Candidatus Aminicenantes bacterium]
MKTKNIIFAFYLVSVLLLTPLLFSDSRYAYTPAPDLDIYFGHISYTEVKFDGNDAVVLREGKVKPEVAVLNLPLAPGDTILTTDNRKCELQFDTGTIIRLDHNSEMKIETILAQSLSSRKKITNFVLRKGHAYIMYKRHCRKELFQFITPNVAVKLSHNCIALVNSREDGGTDIQIIEGKAYALHGTDEKNSRELKIKKSETITILPDNSMTRDAYARDEDFELWNECMNENFSAMHRGKTFIPKPIFKYPEAVIRFAEKFGSRYGEWSWNSLYGYVWRPYDNDRTTWGSWQPYMYGQWCEVDHQLFWVPEETWGWVPYHLGVWVWDKTIGWLWIPGDAFAPAWVMWDYFAGLYMWRPWSIYDWYFSAYMGDGYFDYFGYPSYRTSYAYYPILPGMDPSQKNCDVRRTISKDQLKKPDVPYKLPRKMEGAYKAAAKFMDEKDPRAISALYEIPNQVIAVKRCDLNAVGIQEKALNLAALSRLKPDKINSFRPDSSPYRGAIIEFRRNTILSWVKEGFLESIRSHGEARPAVGKTVPPLMGNREKISDMDPGRARRSAGQQIKVESSQSSFSKYTARFRDWNPDIKMAGGIGVTIRYSSRTNEVHCPELHLSSRGVIASSPGRIRAGSLTAANSRSGFSATVSSGGSSGSLSSGSKGVSSSSGGSTKSGGSPSKK